MSEHADKTPDDKSQSNFSENAPQQGSGGSAFQIVDARPGFLALRRLQELANGSPKVAQLRATQELIQNSSQVEELKTSQETIRNSDQQNQGVGLDETTGNSKLEQPKPIQKKENKTGLPDNLKTGIENLSGMSLDDVKVHRNSAKPAALQAHAYAQGTDIHLGPGQEKHLPNEGRSPGGKFSENDSGNGERHSRHSGQVCRPTA